MAALTICGPLLLAALVVGLSVSLFQAVTQINEMTLVFVPKITAVFVVLLMMGGWMIDRAVEFTTQSIQSVAVITR
ncbi:MAG: flagellar biosynthetic protein FliQ [Myxococcota bacterium]|nr:flagellar biosynthetic protein FliQ [Myxococcota bacterium]